MTEITAVRDSATIIGVETRSETGLHRRVLAPGSLVNEQWVQTDLTGEPPEVQELAAEMWTADVIEAYKTELLARVVPPTPADYAAAIQGFVDVAATARGYESGFALSSYLNSTVQSWALEASTFIAWRDQVWQYVYAQFALVQSGKRPQPTIAQLQAELPSIDWPN